MLLPAHSYNESTVSAACLSVVTSQWYVLGLEEALSSGKAHEHLHFESSEPLRDAASLQKPSQSHLTPYLAFFVFWGMHLQLCCFGSLLQTKSLSNY